jgi:hypothetical protein
MGLLTLSTTQLPYAVRTERLYTLVYSFAREYSYTSKAWFSLVFFNVCVPYILERSLVIL